MDLEVVYVTVGTTKFEALIREITAEPTLRVLKSRGCRKLVLQVGYGSYVGAAKVHANSGIVVEQYDFNFDPVRTDIMNAKLIIGHAGAGTCIDILNYQKPGLIVVNDKLMDNHQKELALQLAAEGYVYCCHIGQLKDQLEKLDLGGLKHYGRPYGMDKFVTYLNGLMS